MGAPAQRHLGHLFLILMAVFYSIEPDFLDLGTAASGRKQTLAPDAANVRLLIRFRTFSLAIQRSEFGQERSLLDFTCWGRLEAHHLSVNELPKGR